MPLDKLNDLAKLGEQRTKLNTAIDEINSITDGTTSGDIPVTATGTTTPRTLGDRFSTGFKSFLDTGGTKDHVAIGVQPIANSTVVVRSDSNDDTSIASTVQIQRLSRADEGYTNPKALRVYTLVEGDNPQTEWAISGEIDNYSTLGSTGNTAVSGVARKFTTASVFAGHFQSQDKNTYTVDTDVSPCLGIEVNQIVKGPDHPTANDSGGNRLLLDLIPISDSDNDPEGSGQIGTAIRIRNDNAARSNGYFRFGVRLEDGKNGNPNPMSTGILIDTSGALGINAKGDNTIAHYQSTGSPAVGAIFNGSYTTGSAIRISTGSAIGWESTNNIKQFYDSGSGSIKFTNNGTNRLAITMGVNPVIQLNGLKVLSERQPAISNSVGGDESSKINEILVTLRSHGLISS